MKSICTYHQLYSNKKMNNAGIVRIEKKCFDIKALDFENCEAITDVETIGIGDRYMN